MRILVSNPSFQYSLQTIRALQAGGHQVYFATTYAYNKNIFFLQLIKLMSTQLAQKIASRQVAFIKKEFIITHPYALVYQFFFRFFSSTLEERSFKEDVYHDKWVSKWVKMHKPDFIIGYEKSCLLTFEQAKKYGAICWLDLSQVHPDYIATLRSDYKFFKTITGADNLFRIISQRKIDEYSLANKILCLSTFAQQTMIAGGIPPDKLLVNPLGFNPNIFFANTSNLKTTNQRCLHFVYAGIVTKRKGIHQLLEIFSKLDPLYFSLTIIGPEGDASDLLYAYKHHKHIQYLGSLNQDTMAAIFRSADVFVFTSFLDSWGAVVIEAMACGLPVITTTTTGAAQLVNTESGFVIEPNDVDALEKAIYYFANNYSQLANMGLAAANAVKAYTWKEYENRLLTYLCVES